MATPKKPESPKLKTANAKATAARVTVQDAVDHNVNRVLDEVVDQAVARISDDKERDIVREGVATVVRDTLVELAEGEARKQASLRVGAPQARVIAPIGDAAQAAINIAKQVEDIGFTEFTAGLIKGTFDTIVAMTIEQIEAYAQLVANLAKTLEQFQAENVSEAEINAFLAARYPDGLGGTVVRPDFVFEDLKDGNGNIIKSGNDRLLEVLASLKLAAPLLGKSGTYEGTPYDFILSPDPAPSTETDFGYLVTTGEDQIETKVKPAIGLTLAFDIMEHLRAMAREGMNRIVIPNGKLLSKLTFRVVSRESDVRTESDYNQRSFSASVRGGASWGWGRIRARAGYSSLRVRTVNETNFDAITTSTEIIGQVEINFRTQSFAPFEPQAAAPLSLTP